MTVNTKKARPAGGEPRAALTTDAEHKNFATLAAEAALHGFALHELPGGGYAIARWQYAKVAGSLAEVAAFLDRVAPRREQ